MAKQVKDDSFGKRGSRISASRQKRTSIGCKHNKTRPNNKRKRKNWKRYRGQGGRR